MTILTVLTLASARLLRAFAYDTIGEPARAWAYDQVELTPEKVNQLDGPQLVRREWGGKLLDCDHCLGFWSSLAVAVAWKIPPLRPVVWALATAAVVSLVVDHYPGWDPDPA